MNQETIFDDVYDGDENNDDGGKLAGGSMAIMLVMKLVIYVICQLQL